MSVKIIDGREYSKTLLSSVAKAVLELEALADARPMLAVFRVGDNEASKIYVRNKLRTALDCGISTSEPLLANEITEEELIEEIALSSDDTECHGILVQLPLPDRFDEAKIVNSVNPAKDVDGLHVSSVGLLWCGQYPLLPALRKAASCCCVTPSVTCRG